ncbi:hypothetical protein T552_00398 [Pneumocystis carinii B80]|uniref:Mis18 domain-containing protein n=1 Tax=Pneumocystis carinii (strain B80) TaxID=1408658 RepID=A0A0W4ZQP2_PNEC8|nr:hypothetical protein T552_00398 [Pneumocystis carinii B80]KTW30685.1 hypothetical protein T552_00398 [Pneumocystis carinii B80]
MAEITEESPTVFQCVKCRSVVGDSYAWSVSHRENNTITLSEVPEDSIIESEVEECTPHGNFTEISCKHCKGNLGRIYKSTPRRLDDIRDMFTFNLDNIISYQLGPKKSRPIQSMNGIFGSFIDMEIQNEINKLKSFTVAVFEQVEELQNRSTFLETELQKVKNFSLDLLANSDEYSLHNDHSDFSRKQTLSHVRVPSSTSDSHELAHHLRKRSHGIEYNLKRLSNIG